MKQSKLQDKRRSHLTTKAMSFPAESHKNGRISTITDLNGSTTIFKYDARGNLTQVIDAENGITQYEYNSAGKIIRVVFPNQTEKIFAYDSLNRISAA